MKLYTDAELAKILDQDIFHMISAAADKLGVECYVVGGYVRDIFLERPSNDIDVVVVGKPLPPTPSPTGEGERPWGGELPDVLDTDKAMELWRKAQRAGYVDEHFQPLISRTQAALLADAMAERLGIKEKWKVFEGLWHRNNMYNDYYRAMNQLQSLTFQDELKQLFK